MIRTYFKVALRNISQNKLYTGINVLGLSIGVAVVILVTLFVQQENSYEAWIPNVEDIYRVYTDGSGSRGVSTPCPLAEALRRDLPEVTSAAALHEYRDKTLFQYDQQKLYASKIAMVDSSFFKVFDFPFLYGNRLNALREPNSLVLSKSLAQKFFGSEDPIGQTIRFNGEADHQVSGVIDDLPGNTHLDHDAFLLFDWFIPDWRSGNVATYVKLSAGQKVSEFAPKMSRHIRKFVIREFEEEGITDNYADMISDWGLQNLRNIHLDSREYSWISPGLGDRRLVRILIAVALIILFIASINYVNLTTALATQRAKEVGVRKVSGAGKMQLVGQFLSESVVQSLVAVAVALAMAQAVLPYFNIIRVAPETYRKNRNLL